MSKELKNPLLREWNHASKNVSKAPNLYYYIGAVQGKHQWTGANIINYPHYCS